MIGRNEVLIKIRSAGICGSDKNRFLGLERLHHYPIVLGHEFAGEVVEAGNAVTLVRRGDRVVGVPILPCHKCIECQQGNFAQCEKYCFVGVQVQGSYAEYIKLPESNALKLADTISYDEGALVEPSTVALHALELVRFRGGEDVAIIGGGTIGLLTCEWAKILGARRVFIFDLDSEMLELSKKFGADVTLNTNDAKFYDTAMEKTSQKGFAYVFDAAGVDFTFKLAFRLAGTKSSICYVGIPNRELSYPADVFFNLYKKEFQLTGSLMSFSAPFPGKEWDLTLKQLEAGKLKFYEGLILNRLPLRDIALAQGLFRTPGATRGKIMLFD